MYHPNIVILITVKPRLRVTSLIRGHLVNWRSSCLYTVTLLIRPSWPHCNVPKLRNNPVNSHFKIVHKQKYKLRAYKLLGEHTNVIMFVLVCYNINDVAFLWVNTIIIDLSGNYVTTAWKWGWGAKAYANTRLLWPFSLTSMQLWRNYRKGVLYCNIL